MPFRFRIEAVWRERSLGFARSLDQGDFRVTSTSTLGGYKVASCDIPRKLKPDGSLALDLVGFTFTNPEDAGRLRVGDLVLLEG